MTTATTEAPHTLYRLFDSTGALLYVGITVDPRRRLAEHRDKSWWETIANVTLESHPTREAVAEAERAAIAAEGPRYNTQLIGGPSTVRTIRVPTQLWEAAQERAWERREKRGVSGPLRMALRAYALDPEALEAACAAIITKEKA